MTPVLVAVFDEVIAVNLRAAIQCAQAVLPVMLRARFGRIVNVSSVVAERANPGQANYVAAKAGLLGLTRTVAREMARKGVTCNAVTPGVIAVRTRGGAGRVLGSDWYFRPNELTMSWAMIRRRRWLALSGSRFGEAVQLALKCPDIDKVRDVLAQAGVHPI